MPEPRFTLIYGEQFDEHLASIERKYWPMIRDTMEEQLTYQPTVSTKNRKILRPPGVLGATWEIRLGPNNEFRVFYDVEEVKHEVRIIAVGVKLGSLLFIGGKETES